MHKVTDTSGQVHSISTDAVVAGIYEGDRELTCDHCGSLGNVGPKSGGTVAQAVESHRVAVSQTDEDRARAAAIIARFSN